jgi:hypothetical protein
MGICMSAITCKNVITDNLRKKDECGEILKLFKVVAALQVKMVTYAERFHLTIPFI